MAGTSIYEIIEQETGFNIDQIRKAERHMIGYQKLIGDPPYSEGKFKRALNIIKERMQFGLTFETLVELKWPKFATDQVPSTATSIGPGFIKTQLRYEGTHVNNRNTAENGTNHQNNPS